MTESPTDRRSPIPSIVRGGFLGLFVGALVSFLFRPTFFGAQPTLMEWYTEALVNEWAGTIIVCTLLGLAAGAVLGYIIFLLRKQASERVRSGP
jgi:hypothetical protein